MKIGWVKLTMSIELDYNTAQTGYCEMRVGWFRELIRLGHTIKCLSAFSKDSLLTYNKVNSEEFTNDEIDGPYDMSWLKSVEYDIDGYAEDCDLLIVEPGALSWQYGMKNASGHHPQMRRCVDVLNSYKGTVLIEQSDPDLPFPFWKMAFSEKPWDKKNPYCKGNPTVKDYPDLEKYGWANYDEIFEDKNYVVLLKTKKIDEVIKTCDGNRFGYGRVQEKVGDKLQFIYAPQAYDCSLLNYGEENPGAKFNVAPQFDLIYAGYPRNREKRFLKRFINLDRYVTRCVTGPNWDKDKAAEMNSLLQFNSITNFGRVPWKDINRRVNDAACSLYLGVPRSTKLGWETSRPFEAVMNGSVILYYSEDHYLVELFGEKYCIDKYDDPSQMIYSMANSSFRGAFHDRQSYMVKGRSWKWFIEFINEELRKIKVKVKFGCEKFQEQEFAEMLTPELQMLEIEEDRINEHIYNTYCHEYDYSEHNKFNCFGNFDIHDEVYCKFCPWKLKCQLDVAEKAKEQVSEEVHPLDTIYDEEFSQADTVTDNSAIVETNGVSDVYKGCDVIDFILNSRMIRSSTIEYTDERHKESVKIIIRKSNIEL